MAQRLCEMKIVYDALLVVAVSLIIEAVIIIIRHIPSPEFQTDNPNSQLNQSKATTYCLRVSTPSLKSGESHHDFCPAGRTGTRLPSVSADVLFKM